MNLLADESVEALVVKQLREDGHVLLYVAELDPGIDDEVVEGAEEQVLIGGYLRQAVELPAAEGDALLLCQGGEGIDDFGDYGVNAAGEEPGR